jgi:hypothetical protein
MAKSGQHYCIHKRKVLDGEVLKEISVDYLCLGWIVLRELQTAFKLI